MWQVRRESNPQPPDLESGALPIGATDLKLKLFYFRLFMQQMLVTKFTIFFKLNFVRSLPFILCSRIISSLAFCACESNKYSIHY